MVEQPFAQTLDMKRQADRQEAIGRARAWAESNYVLLDTETTGLNSRAEIMEIAILDREGNVLLDTLVKPADDLVSVEAYGTHHITDSMVAEAPSFNDLWPGIQEILAGADVVLAYGVNFDLRLIRQSLRSPFAWPKRAVERLRQEGRAGCVMETYAAYFGDWSHRYESYSYQSLINAMSQCGLAWEGTAHRALADCLATRLLLEHMAKGE